MTAHWGVPDPAAVEGTEAEKHLAFADAYRMLNNRISIFISLPMNTLDKLALQKRLDEIGRESAEGRLSIVAIDLPRRLAAEALGTAILVATVVGSGIMADRLTRRRRACAARQHAADRRDPGRADHDPRPDLRARISIRR